MRWFTRGDVDGFFGLFVDNLVQLLLIVGLCGGVLGFGDDLLYGRVLPGVAISMLIGNLFYAWQAKRLAAAAGRDDVCALPYGINTVSLFAHVFLVMLPAKLAAQAAGHPDPARVAWQAGLLACLGSGLIELCGALVAERIRRATPRAALLSTLAGIAMTFIALGFLFRTFANPIVGLATLGVILLTYFGGVRFKGGLPGGLVAVVLGTVLAHATGIAGGAVPSLDASVRLPVPVVGDLLGSVRGDFLAAYATIIVPMGLFNLIGSLQNIESAEAAGDRYATEPSLAVNGIGTIGAALFGSVFPTTIYIGHPGWKAMGAGAGYSILNALAVTMICLTGTLSFIAWLVPIDAGMAIVLWIGIVITAQAFQATPRGHAPAVAVGLLPGVAAWGAILIKTSLRVAGYGAPDGPAFGPGLFEKFARSDLWLEGAFALEQGFIFSAMVLSAASVAVIERKFLVAATWCAIAAALSALGLMHAFAFTPGDTAVAMLDPGNPGWKWAGGYAVMAALFGTAQWTTRRFARGKG